MTSLNPVHKVGCPDRRGDPAPQGRIAEGSQGAGARGAEGGRHPAGRAAHRRLSAPVLRRHAPARDDRDGPRQRAVAAHRRRADDGPRRDDAGADPRADAQAPGRLRHRDHHDHPRPRRRRRDRRRGRRHVRGAGGREGSGQRAVRAPAAPVHVGPARLAAAPRGRHRPARADPGHAAVAAVAAPRLPLQPALPVRLRPLQAGAARARAVRGASRPRAGVLPRRRDEGPRGRENPRRRSRPRRS